MKNKIKTLLKYGVPTLVLILVVMGYADSKSNYKIKGKDCNLKALEWTQEMTQFESLYFYEKYYISCMRSNGYLLEGFDYTIDSVRS